MSSTKTKAAAETAAASIETNTAAATKTMDKTMDKTLEAVKEGMEKAAKSMEGSQVKMKENVEKAMKTAEEALAFNQGNMEALVKASQIYAAGFQDISKHIAAASKASMEESVAFTKSLMGVKSVKEAVHESSKLTDATVKLAEQAIAPLTARMTMAVEKFGKTH
jgi:hypothetical protein